ncbi:MAG TPA: MFS transporter [Thermoanaerobaculia bacterium]|nr:MFS transporter [Thermoanaerobaculia bacterium]
MFTPRFVALWLFQFGTFFSAFQLLPVIPLRILALGGSKAAAGLFLAVYTIASAFAAPVMGTIADHIGRRRMLVTASILFVVFSLAYGVVPWLPLVLIIALLHGAMWSGILSSASAIMTGFIPISRRTEGLGYWGLASTAAIAIAPAAGMFVYRFGWFVLCAEIAAFSALMAVWAAQLPAGNVRDESASFPRVAELWDFRVLKTAASFAMISFGYGGITSYVAILSRERGIFPESLFFTVFATSVVVVRILIARVGDRHGPKVLLYPAFAAFPVAFALLATAQSQAQMIAAAILWGTGLGAAFPAFMTFLVTNTDEQFRGRTFGSMILAFDTGIALGSIVVGAIGSRWSLGTAFWFAAALSCLAFPIFLNTSRQLVRGTAVAGTAPHAGT